MVGGKESKVKFRITALTARIIMHINQEIRFKINTVGKALFYKGDVVGNRFNISILAGKIKAIDGDNCLILVPNNGFFAIHNDDIIKRG